MHVQVVIKARVSTMGAYFSDSLDSELKIYMALNAQGPLDGIPCLYSAGVWHQQLLAGQQLLKGQQLLARHFLLLHLLHI